MEILHADDLNLNKALDEPGVNEETPLTPKAPQQTFIGTDMKDTSPVEAILKGTHCLHGVSTSKTHI